MKLAPLLLTLIAFAAHAEWRYDRTTDRMTGHENLTAMSTSVNTFSLGAPYAGSQHAYLTARKHPRHGNDIVLRIERGQFNCMPDDCGVLARFDNRPPQRYAAVGPEDHRSDMLFIRDFRRFYGQALKSKRVLIEAVFFNNGTKQLEFDVEGLDPKFLAVKAAPPARPKCTPQEKTRLWREHREFPDRVQPSCE